jgi:squalene-associated FAD-dependent desaturase
VTELLQRFDQTDRLCRLMWRPLCIAALNTPPERASAQVFLAVLRDSLGAKRAASDMLIPRVNLSALFPERAADYIQQRQGQVLAGAAVKQLRRSESGSWLLSYGNGGPEQAGSAEFDTVIIATGAEAAGKLLAGMEGEEAANLPAFDYEPITTCYLQYDSSLRLPRPFYALIDDAAQGRYGQFVFDRGQLDAAQSGLLAVVVSASNEAIALGAEALAKSLAAQLTQDLHMPALLAPQWQQVITEKRATFACTPGLVRPANDTGLPGLALAGDYTAGEYPATLEAAVRSGMAAARLLLDRR